MLDRSLAGDPVNIGTIIRHTIARVVRDIVLVELALPKQHIIDELGRILQDLLLGILLSKSTRGFCRCG